MTAYERLLADFIAASNAFAQPAVLPDGIEAYELHKATEALNHFRRNDFRPKGDTK